MGAGGQPAGAVAELTPQPGQCRRIDGQRRRGEFQVPGRLDGAGAKRLQPVRIGGGLRPYQVEQAEDLPGESGCARPTSLAAGGDAPVQQHQPHPAPTAGGQQVGPDLAFQEGRGVRLPMVQEARHPARHVQRHEAVQHPGTAFHQQPGRGDGPRRDQHGDGAGPQAFDHRQRGDGFPDARGMQPDQRTGRARRRVDALAFAEPRRILLAARDPAAEHAAQDRCAELRRRPPRGGDHAPHSASACPPRPPLGSSPPRSAAGRSLPTPRAERRSARRRPCAPRAERAAAAYMRSQVGSTRYRTRWSAPRDRHARRHLDSHGRQLRHPRRRLGAAGSARAIRRDHDLCSPCSAAPRPAAPARWPLRPSPTRPATCRPWRSSHRPTGCRTRRITSADQAPVLVPADQHMRGAPARPRAVPAAPGSRAPASSAAARARTAKMAGVA